MSALYRCNGCERMEKAPQPKRYTTVPDAWFWRERTAAEEQMHACSEPCVGKMVAHGYEGWRQIQRGVESPRPKVGQAACKSCARMKTGGPCLFHRPREKKTKAVVK